jgi:hypothetical protein
VIAVLLRLARASWIVLASAAAGERALAGSVDGGDSRIQALVVRRPEGPRDADELARALARLGTPALPDLFELQLSAGFEAFLPPELDPSTWIVAPDDVPGVALRAPTCASA